MPGPPANYARQLSIVALVRDEGLSFGEVARRYGVSRQRIHQILLNHGVDWIGKQRRAAIIAKRIAEERTLWHKLHKPVSAEPYNRPRPRTEALLALCNGKRDREELCRLWHAPMPILNARLHQLKVMGLVEIPYYGAPPTAVET